MAERHRSKDMSRDTDKVLGDKTRPGQQGRSGGDLARKLASRDERKRAGSRPAGATRVTGGDERDSGMKSEKDQEV